jgi:hypothetical protein
MQGARSIGGIIVVALALVACGGSSTGGSGGKGGSAGTTSATGGAASSGGVGGAGGAGGSPNSAKPAAPVLDVVMPMAGVLHVGWTTSSTCDFIDAERKDTQNTTYAAAWEVAGDKTNHMDGSASQNLTYTYRLRCKVGDTFSDYSNEKSGNPVGP